MDLPADFSLQWGSFCVILSKIPGSIHAKGDNKMKHFQWTVTGSDGFDHSVTLTRSVWSNKLTITIDGAETVVKPRSQQVMTGIIDHTLPVGGKTCHLVVMGQQADLAVDGQYLTAKRPYLPYRTRPKWVWIFWILCLAVGAMGGALPWLIGLTAAIQCGRTAVSPYIDEKKKLRICIGITVAAWAALALSILALALLLS